jgi:hypothetical protein
MEGWMEKDDENCFIYGLVIKGRENVSIKSNRRRNLGMMTRRISMRASRDKKLPKEGKVALVVRARKSVSQWIFWYKNKWNHGQRISKLPSSGLSLHNHPHSTFPWSITCLRQNVCFEPDTPQEYEYSYGIRGTDDDFSLH